VTIVDELTALDTAVERGVGRLFELQRPEGFWVAELESNVTMTSQHLFWNHFLGLRTPELDRRIAAELLSRQRDDGTWAIWWDGPADLSTTIEAYVALKLAGVDPGPKARAFIQEKGGIPRSRVFTKCFLALLGQWPWQRIPSVPPELVLLPPSAPFSIYHFGCWARQTVVALSVVMALRPVRPARVDLGEIGARPGSTRPPARPSALRRRAIATAERWMRERQEADGSWGGIQPPWVWAIVMLASLGHGFEDETFRKAVEGWQGFMVDEGERLRPEACQSPVWDTALALLALGACGLTVDDPRVARAVDWLLAEEIRIKGDWAVRRPNVEPGGWAFEYQNDLYPDIDDTAVIAVALRKLGAGEEAVRRGLDWVAGMQSRNGGWGAFDADGKAYWWLYEIPFCDFGRVTDEPSSDVTAHVLEAFGPDGSYPDETRRGLDWLLAEQEDDGSWFGRWGVNHVYGTGAALPALEACGFPPDHPAMRRAVTWLDSVQRPDGGFGEDILSYRDSSLRGRGNFATASQTAWALLGYVAAGEAESSAARRSADFLCISQYDNGDWSEEHFTGTGFPLDFMIRYHLYRLNFPLLALGRLRERLTG
jgi:squalene-hopene/tetraprenyl-beta-curcumene cyclase